MQLARNRCDEEEGEVNVHRIRQIGASSEGEHLGENEGVVAVVEDGCELYLLTSLFSFCPVFPLLSSPFPQVDCLTYLRHSGDF